MKDGGKSIFAFRGFLSTEIIQPGLPILQVFNLLFDLNSYLFCEDVSPNLGFLGGQLDGEHIGHMNPSCKLCSLRNQALPFLHNQL